MKKNFFSMMIGVMAICVMVFVMASVAAAADETTAAPEKQAVAVEPLKKAPAPKGMLDGKHFVGEMAAEGKTTGDPETIIFRSGTFHSKACDAYGFTPAPYVTTPGEGGAITFTAECTSPKAGKMQWEGTVKGDALEATATMIQEGKEPTKMWAKGTMQKMMHEGKGAKTSAAKGTTKKTK